MKLSSLFLFCCAFFISCGDDDERTCTVCTSEIIEAFELCREGDGSASVDGQNTGTDYDRYLSDLEETGVVCGQ